MPQNSLIIIVRSSNYKLGDIVAFKEYPNDTKCTVHRIVAIDGDIVTTCGDANVGSNDEPVNIHDIKGKVLICIPKLGLVLNKVKTFVTHPVTTVFIFIILIGLVVLSFIPFKKRSDEPSIEEIKAEIQRLKSEETEQNGE